MSNMNLKWCILDNETDYDGNYKFIGNSLFTPNGLNCYHIIKKNNSYYIEFNNYRIGTSYKDKEDAMIVAENDFINRCHCGIMDF